jgi:quercetin dioxygenase-like cupin family protein
MTEIVTSTKIEFSIDPAIIDLLPAQGSIELQRDAAGKVHQFHTHPVDEILVIIKGALKFEWDGGERVVMPGDTILLPAGTVHRSEALECGAIYAIATRAPASAQGSTARATDQQTQDNARETGRFVDQ